MNDLFYIDDDVTPQTDIDDFVSEEAIPGHSEIPVAGEPEADFEPSLIETLTDVDGTTYEQWHVRTDDGSDSVEVRRTGYRSTTIDPRAVHIADTVSEDESSEYFGAVRPVEVIDLNETVEDGDA